MGLRVKVSKQFGEAFEENFYRRREIGAACCVYHKGEKVVDLWGGVRNETTVSQELGDPRDVALRRALIAPKYDAIRGAPVLVT